MSRVTYLKTFAAAAMLAAAGAASPATASPAALAAAHTSYAAPAVTTVGYRGGHRHHHHYYRPFIRPYGFYAYSAPVYVAPSRCGWLRAKAINTGSSYWRHRYHACLND
jgi:hypothetical protein